MKSVYILLVSSILFFSCQNKESDRAILPESMGKVNTLQVVISNELWGNNVGEEVRNHFAAPTYGLPQDEPIFSINQLQPSAFKGFAHEFRLFLNVKLGDEDKVIISHDSLSKPQVGAYVIGTSAESIVQLLKENNEEIIKAFQHSEIKEKQRRAALSLMPIEALKKRMGISMKVPFSYHTAKDTTGFYWIRKELKSGSTNIIIYEVPLDMIGADSIIGDIIKIRDSVGGKYLPVENDSQFITEEAYAPYLFKSELDGKFAYETKGIWEVKGEFMSGPFVNYAVRDEENNRYLVLEGFTYSPASEKRDLQFELESILKSVKFQ